MTDAEPTPAHKDNIGQENRTLNAINPDKRGICGLDFVRDLGYL